VRVGLQVASGAWAFALALALALAGCGRVAEAPALPEVLVVVDTNLPVPLVAGRLRVDLYAEDGTWFETSDFGRPDRRDWPASFSVYSDDESRERLVWVRLRAYPEGAVDSYAGERFRDIRDPFAHVIGDDHPRLSRNGNDVTPATEPSPLLTVDRLVLVKLRPETRGRVRVLLHGACVGTMVKMSAAGTPVLGDASSCVATEKEREVVEPSATEDDLTTPSTSAAGTWLTGTCPPPSETATRVCVAGGATILGSRENSDYGVGSATQLDSNPPRVFGLSPFFVDRDELSVGELTALVAKGYSGALPVAHDGPLAQPTLANPEVGCTWSFKTNGRDDYPVTCVSFRAARGICQYRGGDILTEAQWEHVATIAGRTTKTRYPWGNDPPTCDRAVWGRIPIVRTTPECNLGDGPRRLGESARDLSPLGIRGLFGSVVEWVLDDAAPFESRSWANASVVDPHAELAGSGRVYRGSAWMGAGVRATLRFRSSGEDGYVPVGVRCAYPAKKP
jgi:formylglycine-generating enzyme required for sulfatase activity